MGKNLPIIYWNMQKDRWSGELPSQSIVRGIEKADYPIHIQREIEKHEDIEERDSMYVIPRR